MSSISKTQFVKLLVGAGVSIALATSLQNAVFMHQTSLAVNMVQKEDTVQLHWSVPNEVDRMYQATVLRACFAGSLITYVIRDFSFIVYIPVTEEDIVGDSPVLLKDLEKSHVQSH
jgi:hypothetical protein